MERTRTQKLLRSQLLFRAGMFLIAVVCLTTGIWLAFCNQALSGVLIGVGGSAIVWALVETIDFCLKTKYQYENDRNNFIRLLDDSLYTIQPIFKTSLKLKTDIPWNEVYDEIYKLYNDMAKYSSNNSIYTISKEFYDVSQYIIRAFWLLDSNLYLPPAVNRILPKDSKEYQYLYSQFVIDETEVRTVEMPRALIDLKEGYSHRLLQKEITLSFEPYGPDKAIFRRDTRGDLVNLASTDTTSYPFIETLDLKTFRPHKDIEEYMMKSQKYGIMRTVLYLAFRRIDEYKI